MLYRLRNYLSVQHLKKACQKKQEMLMKKRRVGKVADFQAVFLISFNKRKEVLCCFFEKRERVIPES